MGSKIDDGKGAGTQLFLSVLAVNQALHPWIILSLIAVTVERFYPHAQTSTLI